VTDRAETSIAAARIKNLRECRILTLLNGAP
jgi:hypothetical protein